ncbi:MAG: YedE family putative selenium transporter [Candidatus Subteraquimicrobiales bacterium]|nr:YedE family putative selenium transporter [Candidatus Subteraquimicrobiales bacterium]
MKKENLLILMAGAVVGLFALVLVAKGNPPNMGFCIACFERDIAGALGLHRASLVQYIRPEIIGLVLGAMVAAFAFKEHKPEGGSSPAVRFLLGMLVMIGALVFLGCPLRMILRLGGGDLNALIGLFGFIFGIMIGVLFLKAGFSLGRAKEQKNLEAYILPLIMVGFLILLILKPIFNPEAGGPIFFSLEGPGSMHAALILSLIAGLVVGFLAQRARLCLAGGVRDLALIREFYLCQGFLAVLLVVLVGNIALGKFNLGFTNQPIAHTEHLWNFLGMALVGLGSVLLGGCPLRQLILTGSGNTDSAISVFGMITGAAISHNFMLAATPQGVSIFGKVAVVFGLIIVCGIGALNLEK